MSEIFGKNHADLLKNSIPETRRCHGGKNTEEKFSRTINYIFIKTKYSLQVSHHETILQILQRIAKVTKCPSSELVLICNGKVVSSHPMFSLEALDLLDSSATCKLLVLQRPPGPAWLRITVVFLCSSSLPPIVYNHMHSDSPISRVKIQLREALRCSVAEFSLHLADGAALPDAVTLSELGLADDERIYCRIRSEAPEPVPPSGLAAAAAAAREQVRRADAVHFSGVGCKRRRLREPHGAEGGESAAKKAALVFSPDALTSSLGQGGQGEIHPPGAAN